MALGAIVLKEESLVNGFQPPSQDFCNSHGRFLESRSRCQNDPKAQGFRAVFEYRLLEGEKSLSGGRGVVNAGLDGLLNSGG